MMGFLLGNIARWDSGSLQGRVCITQTDGLLLKIRVFHEEWDNVFPETKNTYIGNDVWIGNNAIIIQGITIGDGAVVAAGTVVTKDVPAYAIVAGVQVKVIKNRFDDSLITAMLQIKWWDRQAE